MNWLFEKWIVSRSRNWVSRKRRPRQQRPRKGRHRKRRPRKRRPRKRWPRKRQPRKTISINNSQTKKLRKKKREQRTFIRGKGDAWREVWLEVNRVSLQALSLFVHFATLFKTGGFLLVPLFILHARNDYKYLFNPISWNYLLLGKYLNKCIVEHSRQPSHS